VTDIRYSRHEKAGKPPTVRVTYVCGMSYFDEWLPIEDPRDFVRKHAVKWFWKRGLVCPNTVDEFFPMLQKPEGCGGVPTPTSITVKPDGKFWRVVDAYFERGAEGVA
jgi:DNA repair protein RadD